MTVEFIFCRHGQTPMNIEQKISGGSSNPGLTIEPDAKGVSGVKDAQELGRRLMREHPDIYAVFSSDLARCLQTAVIAFKGRKLTIIPMKEFREIDHAGTEGMLASERNKKWSEFVQKALDEASEKGQKLDPYWKWDNTPFVDKGAEKFRQVVQRASAALIEIAKKKEFQGRKICIIAHNAVIQALMMQSLINEGRLQPDSNGLYPMFFEKSLIPNGGIFEFRCNPDAREEKDKIKYSYNALSRL